MSAAHDLLRRARVLPVLVIEELGDAVPLARALAAGGLSVLEVTLRTQCALDAIAAIARAVPEVAIGAGTILAPDDLARALDAGASFGVSPGLTPGLRAAVLRAGVPFYPGVATATEAMAARDAGLNVLKFFPAEANGGAAALKALTAPLADLAWCPTGGVTPANAAAYRAIRQVLAVGGSWMAPPAAVRSRDWARITALATEAAQT